MVAREANKLDEIILKGHRGAVQRALHIGRSKGKGSGALAECTRGSTPLAVTHTCINSLAALADVHYSSGSAPGQLLIIHFMPVHAC